MGDGELCLSLDLITLQQGYTAPETWLIRVKMDFCYLLEN